MGLSLKIAKFTKVSVYCCDLLIEKNELAQHLLCKITEPHSFVFCLVLSMSCHLSWFTLTREDNIKFNSVVIEFQVVIFFVFMKSHVFIWIEKTGSVSILHFSVVEALKTWSCGNYALLIGQKFGGLIMKKQPFLLVFALFGLAWSCQSNNFNGTRSDKEGYSYDNSSFLGYDCKKI